MPKRLPADLREPNSPWRVALALTLCLLAVTRVAGAKDDPAARTAQLIEVLKSIRVAAQGSALSAEDKAQNSTTFQTLDTYFDYDRLVTEVLAPHGKSLSKDQAAQLRRDFRELVRLIAYPRSGEFVHQAQVKVSAPEAKGKRSVVNVHATLATEEMESDIGFVWEDTGAALRIVDVNFNGVSLVRDYQNQFGKMIKKDGAEGLVKKVTSRLAEERKVHAI